MPWAPWHKAVQLISQAWLCPLLQFESFLKNKFLALDCIALYFLDALNVSIVVLAALLHEEEWIFFPDALFLSGL